MLPAALVYVASLLAFLLTRGSPRWTVPRRRGSPAGAATGPARWSPRARSMLAATVAVVGTVGPHLPWATTHALVGWRRGTAGNGGRSTGSPLVDIKDRLHSQSQQEVFTVKTSQPAYWRMTALDDFNGTGWSLDDTYRRDGSALGVADRRAARRRAEPPRRCHLPCLQPGLVVAAGRLPPDAHRRHHGCQLQLRGCEPDHEQGDLQRRLVHGDVRDPFGDAGPAQRQPSRRR